MAKFAQRRLREEDSRIKLPVMAYCLELNRVIAAEEEYNRLVAGTGYCQKQNTTRS